MTMTREEILNTARYEIKFNSKSSQSDHLKRELFDSYGYSSLFAPRIINNIYFDNLDLDSFQENLTGCSSRTKLRLRWYGDTVNPTEATLELKMRRNLIGWKLGQKISFGSKKLSEMSWNEITKHVREQCPGDLALYLSTSPLPVLMNRYKRDYFSSSSKLIRATIDNDVEFFDQRCGRKLNSAYNVISPDMLVLELKIDANNIDEAEKDIRRMYLPRTKNSKYVVGVSSILGF